MDTEDFSFPTIGSTSSRYIDSPPLWRMSPAASPDPCHLMEARDRKKQDITENKNKEDDTDCYSSHLVSKDVKRKSFSYVKMVKGDSQDGKDDEEEKMDMLWEDFNDESSTRHDPNTTSREMIETGCVQAMKLAKPGGTLISPKKAGMLVLVKVLKRILTIHSQRSTKKPA